MPHMPTAARAGGGDDPPVVARVDQGAGGSDDSDDVTIETINLFPGPHREERRKTLSRVKKN